VHVTLENETDTLEFMRLPKPEKETSTKTTGRSSPLGATVTATGVNFSVFSRKATSIELFVFEREDDARPAPVIHIDSVTNRTYHYWHVFVPGAQAGQIYRGGNPRRRWIDIALESPLEIVEWQKTPTISGRTYRVEARSVVMLFRTLDA
jgi:hypothetical protein